MRESIDTANFSFEVKETDLLGRIGLVTVNGRQFQTPCLLPVVHPVKQIISPHEMLSLGFECLMTNSLILLQRRHDEALQRGVHKVLGFNGAIMTDSGGYQVLEYGSTDLSPVRIADFQSKIHSDLAVPLDKPTGNLRFRELAKETVLTSLRNAELTIKAYGTGSTVWVGPVQGGLYRDLVRSSTKKLVSMGFPALALGSPTEVMENYQFSDLTNMIWSAKSMMPPQTLLHLFGAGHPLTIPLSVALGCDTFDSASYILFAQQGRYMTEGGVLELSKMAYLPCSCRICATISPGELRAMPREEGVMKLALHNLLTLRKEVLRTRQAIYEGRLWDLVQERASAHPALQRAIKTLVNLAGELQNGTPLMKERGVMIRNRLDFNRPEFGLARKHLMDVERRSNKIAVLAAPGEVKPLSVLREYQKVIEISRNNKVDVYRLHPILGLYPAELDFTFPFTQTVLPNLHITRRMLAAAKKELTRRGYKKILLLKAGRNHSR